MNKKIEVSDEIYEKIKDQLVSEPLITEDGLTYCIIRTYQAGCFAGYINREREKKSEATVKNARRLWYWSGASSLSQLASEGVKNPDECKFPCEVNIDLVGIIEVIPATEEAKKSINETPIWKQ